MQNNDFLLKWKPKHEKGLYKYVILKIIPPLIVLFLADTIMIYMYYPVEKSDLHTIFFTSIVVSLTIIWSNLQRWFKEEKRYMEYSKNNTLETKFQHWPRGF